MFDVFEVFICTDIIHANRAGAIPSGPTEAETLVPLTRIEENLVSRYRVHRNLYVMKPAQWSWTPAGTRQLCHRAHVIATPNAGADKVRDCLLEHPDTLAESIQVVFLVLVDVATPEALEAAVKKIISRSPALRIRTKEVIKWAYHLCKARNDCISIACFVASSKYIHRRNILQFVGTMVGRAALSELVEY